MIPCHVASHWVLLVGNLKGKYWDFYDSLPNPMHRSSLRENIRFLHGDRAEVLPGDIIDWPIHTVEGLPTQDNGNDCGIFVMKYMEASLGKDRVDWTRHTSWAKEMPRIRAEIQQNHSTGAPPLQSGCNQGFDFLSRQGHRRSSTAPAPLRRS
ncbi:putative ubiquitin-like-specific protease 1B [Platanthera zijinensis]|uniref:Ubiquitin-like-specific protease 1B n=1 Tax=Platanthera zijinensis TaxID=2320716 RepID=A0AAP0GCI6_9ASPA